VQWNRHCLKSPPPKGVSQNDWDRVIAYQKQVKDRVEVSDEVFDMASLGPKVNDNQVVASVDGIQVS